MHLFFQSNQWFEVLRKQLFFYGHLFMSIFLFGVVVCIEYDYDYGCIGMINLFIISATVSYIGFQSEKQIKEHLIKYEPDSLL